MPSHWRSRPSLGSGFWFSTISPSRGRSCWFGAAVWRIEGMASFEHAPSRPGGSGSASTDRDCISLQLQALDPSGLRMGLFVVGSWSPPSRVTVGIELSSFRLFATPPPPRPPWSP